MTKHYYDAIAEVYDTLYNDPASILENAIVVEILAPLIRGAKAVLDIGCGTGLFLELISPSFSYLGVDPSEKMLGVLKEKFPEAAVVNTSFEEFTGDAAGYFAVALFGCMSYVSPVRVNLKEFGDYFLMFYKDTHHPKCYDVVSEDGPRNMLSDYDLNGAYLYEFSNYVIATNTGLCHENIQGYRCLGSSPEEDRLVI